MQRLNDYFSPDYSTARDRFRMAAEKAGASLEVLPIDATGPRGEELGIDVAWFGSAEPRRALVHSSGLHGVEGFAGSAIQLQLLSSVPALPPGAALVLVHVLNPYGMAWLRRVNENNVDLNRNFRAQGTYSGAPPAYPDLDSFLNPQGPPASDLYYAKAVYFILRYGMTALKQSVVGGQYEYPKGLFFGGKHIEQGPARYQSFLTRRLGAVERLTVIDVHTGLGKFAEDSLLVDFKDYARFRPIFGERVTALQPDAGPAYRIEGGLESMIFREFGKIDPCFIGQEFGTYAGIRVVHALRQENRWQQHGGGGLYHPATLALKRTFCPEDDSWREKVLKRGRELLAQALAALTRDR
jgi:hypothetical protein